MSVLKIAFLKPWRMNNPFFRNAITVTELTNSIQFMLL